MLVVGRPSQLAVVRAERRLSDRLGRDVNAVVVSPDEWEASASGFLEDVKRRPLLPVALDEREGK